MRMFKIFIIMLAVASLFSSCCKKEMSLQDYYKIDMKIVKSDQKPETKAKIAKESGYTLKQYEDMQKKIEKDPKLLKQLSDLRFGEMKKDKGKDKKENKK